MCGINGFNWKDEFKISLMNKKIKHRGPDDEGFFSRKNISLGHVRLSILDLTQKGHQPMFYNKNLGASSKVLNPKFISESKILITYNGEIYNFLNIKSKLEKKGYIFSTNTDTEVILASYLEWGERCVEKFDGMWAFCIYDLEKEILFLSRDRFGEKPLYYYKKEDKFIFSSEIKGIISHDLKISVNRDVLSNFFNYRFSLTNQSIFKDIFHLNPGSNLIYDLKENKIINNYNYYTLKISRNKSSFFVNKKKLFSLIDGSVKSRMISDVDVGCFLSGGLDSSIITYFAKKYNSKLNTFSVGFDKVNELSYSKKVSNFLKTNHHEFILNKDNSLRYIYNMVYHMDEPIGADPGFLPIYFLSKKASKYNKVILSGDGADEIFTGYDRYKLFFYGRFLKNFSFKSKNQIINRLNLMRGKNDLESFFEIIKVFEDDEMKLLNLKVESPDNIFLDVENYSTLNKVQVFDIFNLLPKDFFMKSDKMSSAFGLEQRVPFMNYKIVEFGLSLPVSHRLLFYNEKFILKQIAKEILPKEIYKRRKHGFNVPIDYWFETSFGEELKRLLKKNDHGLYDKSYVYDLLNFLKENNSSFKSRNIIAQKLWSVLVFEVWYEIFIINCGEFKK